MIYFNGAYIAYVFEDVLEELSSNPEYVASPRGQEVKEIRDCSIEITEPMFNLYTNEFRSSPQKYIAAELLWYFSGTNNPQYIENYAGMWKSLHNPDGTVNSAYGNLLFSEKNEHAITQYDWVIQSLKNDKDTRQAFMHFNKPHHQFYENKDQVCTLQALFHIRDNKLHMTLTMRSNDVVLGFMTDWAFFSVLFYHVFLDVKDIYPEIELGSYTHISHSMHLYQRNYELVENMLTKEFKEDKLPLLNTTILHPNGSIKEKYRHIFQAIKNGRKPNYNEVTDNDLINWCFDKLK